MENIPHPQIKVIADGNILRMAEKLSKAEELEGEFIPACDLLIVYAHALVPGATNRSQSGGLRKLQGLLAHPSSSMTQIVILGFLPASDYKRFNYLVDPESPCCFIQLPGRLALTTNRITKTKAWQALARRASEEELEIQCSNFRHTLQSVMAAARIYLGAAIAGHVDASNPTFKRTLMGLQEAANKEGGSLTSDVTELVQSCILHQQRFGEDYEAVHKPTKCDIWVLDDQWNSHRWKDVFEALPFNSVAGYEDWPALERAINSSQKPPSVLMIDCNLSKNAEKAAPTGLELLGCIRSKWQEVRIIFSTAYDDASLALASLRAGANAFFAKQLNDVGDRGSLSYYNQLVSLLAPHEIEGKTRSLWRSFSDRNSQQLREGELARWVLNKYQPSAQLDHMLRLAFFLLFSLIDDDVYWRGNRLSASKGNVYRSVVNLVEAGYPYMRESILINPAIVRKIVTPAAHGSKISSSELYSVLTNLFAILETQTSNAELGQWSPDDWLADWPYRREDLQTDSSYPGAPPGSPVAFHNVADEQGAVELMRGFHCKESCLHQPLSVTEIIGAHKLNPSSERFEDVVFIDDRGDSNGWFEAVKEVLPYSRAYKNVKSFLQIEKSGNSTSAVNLVILDLKLPSFEEGSNALKQIFAWDESVPVITISASSHSVEAIKSLRKGAIDFISKSLPYSRDLTGCTKFAIEFKKKCELLREYGASKVRQRWDQLRTLRRNTKWNQANLTRVRVKVAACTQHQNGSKKRQQWIVPPDPSKWGTVLADEITLLLRMRQRLFFIKDKDVCLPLDNWRWSYVLLSEGSEEIAKLTAILSGLVVERLAMWKWCLASDKSLNPGDWGTANGINIDSEIRGMKFGSEYAWGLRTDALKQRPVQPVWDANLCDSLIACVFNTIGRFGQQYGIQLF